MSLCWVWVFWRYYGVKFEFTVSSSNKFFETGKNEICFPSAKQQKKEFKSFLIWGDDDDDDNNDYDYDDDDNDDDDMTMTSLQSATKASLSALSNAAGRVWLW